MTNISTKIKEKDLQYAVKIYLSDPGKVHKLEDGRSFQILSMGVMNVHEGPDFLDIAVLINGKVVIGNAEFHLKSSYWNQHNHSLDNRYNSVILHIVCENDENIAEKFGTLVVEKEKIVSLSKQLKQKDDSVIDILSTEELQNYALIRLLRFTSNAKQIVNTNNLSESIKIMTQMFLNRYFERTRRRIQNKKRVENISELISTSIMLDFIKKINSKEQFSIVDEMVKLMKVKIGAEGVAMRRELILNVVLPIALSLANEEKRISLFVWYWTTRSAHSYGLLNRKFPNIPQNFIWQQQGMLEYLREIEHRHLNISDAINSYRIGGVLSFLKWGNLNE